MIGGRDCAVIGANTILHLYAETAMIGADPLVIPPSGYTGRLLSSLTCSQERPSHTAPSVATMGPVKTPLKWSSLPTFDSHH
jgi:hypothetical protein